MQNIKIYARKLKFMQKNMPKIKIYAKNLLSVKN